MLQLYNPKSIVVRRFSYLAHILGLWGFPSQVEQGTTVWVGQPYSIELPRPLTDFRHFKQVRCEYIR